MQGSNVDADIENRLMDKGGGEDEMTGESSMEADTLTFVKQIASGNLLSDSGNTDLGPVTT